MSKQEIIPADDPHLRKFGIDQAFVEVMKQYALDNPNKVGEEVSYTPLQMYFLVKTTTSQGMSAMAEQVYSGWAPGMYETAETLPEILKDQFLKMMKATEDLMK